MQSAVISGGVLVCGSREMFCFLKFLFDPATRCKSAEDPGCRNIQGLMSPSSNLSELDNKGKELKILRGCAKRAGVGMPYIVFCKSNGSFTHMRSYAEA